MSGKEFDFTHFIQPSNVHKQAVEGGNSKKKNAVTSLSIGSTVIPQVGTGVPGFGDIIFVKGTDITDYYPYLYHTIVFTIIFMQFQEEFCTHLRTSVHILNRSQVENIILLRRKMLRVRFFCSIICRTNRLTHCPDWRLFQTGRPDPQLSFAVGVFEFMLALAVIAYGSYQSLFGWWTD